MGAKSKSRQASVDIAAELGRLEQRSSELLERRSMAEKSLAAAKFARRKALAADTSAPLGDLTAKVREIEDELETIDGVISDLTDQLDDANQRHADALDGEARSRAAATLRHIAHDVQTPAKAIDRAVDEIAAAANTIANLIPPGLVVLPPPAIGRPGSLHNADAPTAIELAAAIIAEALANRLPEGAFFASIDRLGYSDGLFRLMELETAKPGWFAAPVPAPVTAIEAASHLISERLFARADAVETGEAPPEIFDGRAWLA